MKHVLQVVGKMNIGGAEQLIMNVYRNIDRTKVQFDFLTFYRKDENGYFDGEINALGGKIINVHKPSILHPIRSIGEVRKVLKRTKYDAVHAHIGCSCAFSLVAAKTENVPIRIAHSHNTPKISRTRIEMIYNALLDFVTNICLTKCAACSTQAAEWRFSRRNIAEKYSYVPNAVDFEPYLREYDTDAIKRELKIEKEDTIVLQVANFKSQKNQLFTIELVYEYVKTNRDVRFVFAGRTDGAYAEEVKSKAKALKIEENVLILGQRTDIPQLMAMADVMIMPSLWEGLGIVLIEAQASGLPCIVSNAIQREADIGAGLIKYASLEDINAWVKAIESSKGIERKPVAERKQAIKQSDFNLEKTVKCFEQLYEIG